MNAEERAKQHYAAYLEADPPVTVEYAMYAIALEAEAAARREVAVHEQARWKRVLGPEMDIDDDAGEWCEQVVQKLSNARREALEEACKAVCANCREHGLCKNLGDEYDGMRGRMRFPGTPDPTWEPCEADEIHRLMEG